VLVIENPESPCNFSCTSLIVQQSASFYFKPITTTEVLSHIKQLNPEKSNGSKRIPLKFIVMASEIILLKSFQYIKMRQKNSAIIIDSSVHFLNKVFENCLHERLYLYFEKFNMFTKHQFDLNKNVAHLMQSDYYMIKSATILIK